MENEWLKNPQDIQIQGLLDRYMRSRISNEESAIQSPHLDDDSLAAFVEGNLSEREAKPVIGHLVECLFCRHITAELIRLDSALAEVEVRSAADVSQPSRISEVLDNLLSRIFGANDGAVFAHEEKEEAKHEPENTKVSEK